MIQIGAKGWVRGPPARILHECTVPMIQIGAKGCCKAERGPLARAPREEGYFSDSFRSPSRRQPLAWPQAYLPGCR